MPYPVGNTRHGLEAVARKAAKRSLLVAAASPYGARDPACVVAAPGTQALIQLLPRLSRHDVGILGFTYAEHEACWRNAGAAVETVDEVAALEAFDVAVIVNPNDPDGQARLAGRADCSQGGTLVVDGAFIDSCRPR